MDGRKGERLSRRRGRSINSTVKLPQTIVELVEQLPMARAEIVIIQVMRKTSL